MPNTRTTMAAVKATYSRGKSAEDSLNPWGYYVWRPISFYLAWLCLKLGISANQVTYSSTFFGCTGCILLGFGSYWHAIAGAILVCVGALLDYADGTIARVNRSSSRFGAFLDKMNWYLIGMLLPVGLGLGLFHNPDSFSDSFAQFFQGVAVERSLFLILGFSAALFFTFTMLTSNRLAIELSLDKPSDNFTAGRGPWAVIYAMGMGLLNPSGVLMAVLVLAAAFRFLGIFLLLWWVLTLAGLIATIIRTSAKAGTK